MLFAEFFFETFVELFPLQDTNRRVALPREIRSVKQLELVSTSFFNFFHLHSYLALSERIVAI